MTNETVSKRRSLKSITTAFVDALHDDPRIRRITVLEDQERGIITFFVDRADPESKTRLGETRRYSQMVTREEMDQAIIDLAVEKARLFNRELLESGQ